ncbi:Protein RIK [Rhynchospora pubera]|uniref:Protein RIK n=1 Tax=Rhynchospora pubera TaxID=906938 RepID=A0AAV8HRG0_9POAL|nr:Protein RIK [Rhynchospora pubera]
MTSDMSNASKEPNEDSVSAVATPRKRSKWDQPAEAFTSATVPLTINGTIGVPLPGVISVVSSPLTNLLPVSTLAQPKIQDEVIAREIVINDAEPSLRCKLTKRQTQEEIEKTTGAIVITRGKYRPPNALPDSERPLYLHISASSHLKDFVERIKAVDKATSIVEDMLKQDLVVQPFTRCVFLGFVADPSLNVSSRIRGSNDQFINHIITETGATVVLRGRDSGNHSSDAEESSQPIHLFLSSSNAKSLESARILAENLLDTIAAECGASRVQSSKLFSAIPPPPLLSSTPAVPVPVLPGVPPKSVPVLPPPHIYPPPVATPISQPSVPPYFTNPAPTNGTHYNGYYEGIYPQATPLQQVALALKQASPAAVTPATVSVPVASPSASSAASSLLSMGSSSSGETNKRPTQKRKFQELPVSGSKGLTGDQQNLQQGSKFYKPGLEESNSNSRKANPSTIPPPKKLVELPTNELTTHRSNAMMPPPPPPKFSMPPPSPKFSSIKPPPTFERSNLSSKKSDLSHSHPMKPSAETSQAEPAADTLLKLVEYGEEEDDDEPDQAETSFKLNPTLRSGPKPFWAV